MAKWYIRLARSVSPRVRGLLILPLFPLGLLWEWISIDFWPFLLKWPDEWGWRHARQRAIEYGESFARAWHLIKTNGH